MVLRLSKDEKVSIELPDSQVIPQKELQGEIWSA
jgi:hypothetical protein